MLVASLYLGSEIGVPMRRITEREYDMIEGILNAVGISCESVGFSCSASVNEMDDGGMGSIRVCSPMTTSDRGTARAIAEAWYDDADGVPVSITLNVDAKGRIFEMDIWRVDFGATIVPPTADRIRDMSRPEMSTGPSGRSQHGSDVM